MRIRAIARITWKDLVNLRVANDLVAGLLTISIATAFSVLSLSFGNSARELLSEAMEPTRTVASIVDVVPRGGLFSTRQYQTLDAMVDTLEAEAAIVARSPIVTAIEDDVFRLRNASCSEARMTGVDLWSTPEEAPFLDPAFGTRYIAGGPFTAPGANQGCARPEKRSDACPALPKREAAVDRRGEEAPRLGVIVNLSYVVRHGNHPPEAIERFRKDGVHLPTIPIEFAIPNSFLPPDAADPRVDLCVTGIIDEPSYPELIFTEALAKAYYLSTEQSSSARPQGAFHGYYAGNMRQWETDEVLVPLDGARSRGYWPRTAEELRYVDLNKSGHVPYDRIRLIVRDWQTEGERERIRDVLMRSRSLPAVTGQDADRLLALARESVEVDFDSVFGGTPDDRLRDDLRLMLSELLSTDDPGLRLTPGFKFDAVGSGGSSYRLEDIEAGVFLTLDAASDSLTIAMEPPWNVTYRDARLATALLRLQSVIDAYGIVMFVVVLVLAASASLLLAYGHVLRKTRDIGLLLANGAWPRAVFAIYMSQIALISVAGWVVGIGLSLIAAPFLENAAWSALESFLVAAESNGGFEAQSVLAVTPEAIGGAFLWVVPAALAGGLYPVFEASRADPLSSLSKVA